MDGYDFDYIDRSIMSSGDNPSQNRTAEAYDFSPATNQSDSRPLPLESKPPDGRSSPIATTSRDIGVQSGRGDEKTEKSGEKTEKSGEKIGRGEIQASVLVEPGGEKEKEEEGKEFGSPKLNHSEGGGEGYEIERRVKADNDGFEGRDKKDRKDDKFRKNGNIDKLDGVWIPKDQKKPQEDQEDDNCIVKCLYVTMTCCECSIM